MVSKTITITVDAYEALVGEKQSDESFSDFFLRKFSRDKNLMECFGTLKMDNESIKRMRRWRKASKKYGAKLAKGDN